MIIVQYKSHSRPPVALAIHPRRTELQVDAAGLLRSFPQLPSIL
jgi:hypothetical protein